MIVGAKIKSEPLTTHLPLGRGFYKHPVIALNIMDALLNDPTINAVCHVWGPYSTVRAVAGSIAKPRGRGLCSLPHTQHTCIGRCAQWARNHINRRR